MVVTLSDYILEQEVSTASCDDILLEQAFAEIDVASKLFDAYYKQMLMTEYASDYAMEADTSGSSTETKSNEKWYQKAWGAIVKFFKGIGEWFARQFGKIRDLFIRNKTVIQKAASAMNDEVLAKAVTEEFNKSINEKKTTSDITPGCVMKLINDGLLFTPNSKGKDIETILSRFEAFVKIIRDGNMEALTEVVERDSSYGQETSMYDDIRDYVETLEDIIKTSTDRGSREISKEDLEKFANNIKDNKIDSKLNIIVSRANGIVTALNSTKIPTIYAKDEKGLPVVDANGNGSGVPGFKVDDKAMKVFKSWQTAFSQLTTRLTVVLTTVQTTTDVFVKSVMTVEKRKPGETSKLGIPTEKDTEAQAQLKKRLSEQYKK